MVRSRSAVRLAVQCLAALLVVAAALPAGAQVMKKSQGGLDDLAFQRPELRIVPQIAPQEDARALGQPILWGDFDALQTREGVRWQMGYDRATGLPNYMGGEGIPWIPGSGQGNRLTAGDLGLRPGQEIPVALLAQKALDFIKSNPSLFGVRADEVTPDFEGSGPVLDYLYYVQFDWLYQGIPVERARITFSLNHGNLVEVGQSNIGPAIRKLDARPSLDRETAWQILYGFLGEAGPGPSDAVLEAGRLSFVPVAAGPALQGLPSPPGEGLGYRLAWTLSFHRDGVLGNWEARVDAHTGEILSFRDANEYGSIRGGVYKLDRPSEEVSTPFPHANYSGTTTYADAAGNFPGTSGTSTLSGRYVAISDNCGSISKAADGSGLIDFGSSSGIDCTTPGTGGSGNTHAARTQYWNVTQIKIKAQTYLTRSWLTSKLTDNVNLNNTCNAYWNGSSLNFFRSGGGCWNTGELPGVSLHEFGHGLDSNDGNGSAPDNGSGETYGDITALMQTHASCMGNGFSGRKCGYGADCTVCTGVRELDYAKYSSPTPLIGDMLGSGWCPTSGTGYVGPCNYEGHCESLIATQAVWDFSARDLVAWGLDQASAWQLVDRLWYASRPTATGVYRCPSVTTTDGCVAGSLWRVFRVADDDDGNTTNGTPHSTALYAALNRHKIACTSDTGYNTDSATCPTLAKPAVAADSSGASVVLTWNAISGASTYAVYRNETSCEAGYTRIATVTAPTVTYDDTLVVAGVSYYYRVQAVGVSAACVGDLSDCTLPAACTPLAAPTGLAAVPNGDYTLDLSWNSVPGAVQYALYRGTEAGRAKALVATVSPAFTAYADTGLFSGVTYYYSVRAYASCESLNSNEASGTPTGTCNVPPTFAGLTSASNGLNATCRVTLAWSAGSSNCGGTITYDIFRSDLPGFAPGAMNRIATGVTGTTYTDTGASFKKTYYYIVRAADSVSGLRDANTATRSAYPTGAQATVYSNNFESNMTSWTTAQSATPGSVGALTGTFIRGDPVGTTNNYGSEGQPETGHNGSTNCLFTAQNTVGSAGVDDVDYGEQNLISPTFNLSGYPAAQFDFWAWFLNDHDKTLPGCSYPDYGYFEVSNNGGSSWTTLNYFPESCATEKGCGTNAWLNYSYNLEDYVTLTNAMQFRYRLADHQNTGNAPCDGDLVEGAVDDFFVYGYATCTSCAAPAAPTLSSVAPNGSNRIDLSWSGSATTYAVYRAMGGCPGSGFVQIAGNLTGTTYSDTSVSGGTSYAYKVVGYSAAYCESAASSCLSATATGTCATPPAFAGIATVTNSHSPTCGIDLTWAAATSNCGGTIRYNVYRAESSTVSPSASTLLAKGLSPTSYSDTLNLVYGVTYSYLVRAEDLGIPGSGPSGGTEDANSVVKSDGPSGGVITAGTLFLDDFNSGTGMRGWTKGYFAGNANDWRGVASCTVGGSTRSILRWGGTSCTTNYANNVASLAYPVPDVYGLWVPFDASNLTLSFSHGYRFSTNDGAMMFIQKQSASATFYLIAGANMSGHVYNGTTGTSNAIGSGYACWVGIADNPLNSTTVDLDAACIAVDGKPCAGSFISITFAGTSDSSGQNRGWYLEDVTVTADYGATSCTTAGCAMTVQITPAADSVPAGADLLFEAQHTIGTGPYAYQWTEDGSDLTGATSSTLAVNKPSAQSHTYNCKVTDLGGSCSDVTASTEATGTWTSAGGTSAPVPLSVTPTQITKNNASATDIDVTWDAANCASTDYHIIWGYGADVTTLGGSTPMVSGGKCDMGTGGALNNWNSGVPDPANDPGAGKFVWFLVVSDDGATQEGSWGTLTGGGQRGGTAVSSQCSCTTRDTTTTCATP